MVIQILDPQTGTLKTIHEGNQFQVVVPGIGGTEFALVEHPDGLRIRSAAPGKLHILPDTANCVTLQIIQPDLRPTDRHDHGGPHHFQD